MPSEFRFQRLPAKDRMIKGISPVKDVRIRITGIIVSKNDNSIVVDDSSGSREIIAPKQLTDEFKVKDVVRVFCRVIALEQGYQLQAELVQNMDNLDIEQYRRIIFGAK